MGSVADTHAVRRDKLRVLARETGVEGVLVTQLVNVRYLTGFTGSNAALLVSDRVTVLATDGRYTIQAQRESPDLEHVIERACAPALIARAATDTLRTLAFESEHLSVATHARLLRLDPVPYLLPLAGAVVGLRVVKDERELALLRAACAIGDRALRELWHWVGPGMTERDIARRLEATMIDLGADGLAFDTIVASGPNSAVPHHQPSEREIERGDFLTVDFGALYRGYHADCTRTVVVGREPAQWQSDTYDLVRRAQRAGREALSVGADLRAVDAAARDVVVAAGEAEHFPHGLGHGVGLEIHEAPMLATTSTGRLLARTPVTVEPGVYLPGRGGVRIEDTLVVGEDGPELLTTTPKDLLVL